ncbi:unnamed protein product [Peronospora belbahrii]|uniref:Uncharacterized protein n=1 Tax=Peronospora belbahrii TaxID=622444 RepID=A0AAU9KN55_9STRA|nr:unnamed protein product [Peronospora belbahrii]
MDSYFNDNLPKCGHRRKYLINAVPREIAFAHSMLKHCMQHFVAAMEKELEVERTNGDILPSACKQRLQQWPCYVLDAYICKALAKLLLD